MRTHIQYERVTFKLIFFVFFYILQVFNQQFLSRFETRTRFGPGISWLNCRLRHAGDKSNNNLLQNFVRCEHYKIANFEM